MKDKLQLNRTNIIMLSIVLIHSLISLWTDKLIFSYNPISFRYAFFKIIFLICVFAFWKLIFYVISSIKNNVIIQRQVIYFLIYAGIMLILMILIWPGVWRNDEFYILNAAKELRFLGWYHAISSMTYIMSLMFMPFAAGIVIVQLLLISGICSYIISKFEESFLSRIKVRKRSLLLVLLFIPFLLLPVIDHNFYPMRHVLNGYFELLLIFEFLLICLKKQKITTNHLCFLYILSVVVCSWRSEQIYYVIMIPVILFTLGKNILTIQKKLIFTMLLFMAVVAINRFNSSISDSTRYKVIATVMPVTELVKAANPVEDKELLDMLGKVVYLDIIYDNPQLYGEVLFWFYGLDKQGEYTDEDYKDYQTAFVKLALKYPGVLIKERINNFAQTAALVPDIKVNIFRTYMLFDDFTNDDIPEFFTLHDAGLEKNRYPYFVRSNKLIYPFSVELRSRIICFLECIDISDGFHATWAFHVFWNLIPPIAFLVCLCIGLLIKKKWQIALLAGSILLKFPLIFLTAPQKYFMYYFSLYLMGYFALFACLVFVLSKRRGRITRTIAIF